MFNEVEGLLQQVTSGGNEQAIAQAVEQHVGAMSGQQVQGQLQSAASNASNNGQPDIAQQITSLLQQHQNDPEGLKGEVISLIQNNPQILQHFEPDFAKGLLSRI